MWKNILVHIDLLAQQVEKPGNDDTGQHMTIAILTTPQTTVLSSDWSVFKRESVSMEHAMARIMIHLLHQALKLSVCRQLYMRIHFPTTVNWPQTFGYLSL